MHRQVAVRGVNSVDHAIRLITFLAQEAPQGANVTELTNALALPRPTVYRVLTTLQDQEWVVREGKRYRLTLRLLALAESAFSVTAIQTVCQPHLWQLSQATGETVHFAVLDGGKAGYIAKVDGEHAIRMMSHVGWRGPLHATAVGKAMLAWSDPAWVQAVASQPLERYTGQTLVTADALLEALQAVRQQGYAVDDQELLSGLVCVAAPVVVQGRVLGAVSISGPDSRRSTLLASAKDVCNIASAITASYA